MSVSIYEHAVVCIYHKTYTISTMIFFTITLTSHLAVYFGISTVQLQKDEKHVNIQVKQKPFMTM